MATSVDGQLQDALGDRYRIDRELGRGGMATVFLAHDTRHDRRVALKVLDATIAGSLGADRFLREIGIAAKLTHPHIVPLYDSGQARGVLYYVMPFIEGESLRQRLRGHGPMSLRDVTALAREVASALDYAHRQGIVHRDIKPENIMLSESHAVILDFGIARAVAEATTANLTQTGVAIGTPMYMSPEQVDGAAALSGRSDQYSLACVLYELITGQPPFTGSTAMSIMAQHLTAEPPPLHASEPVPEKVEKAIRRALGKTQDERFASAGELAAALDSVGQSPQPTAVRLPGRASGRTAGKLPAPLTPLVGRDRELKALVSLLQQPSVRLLNLHGPGGIGKTRLALEAAARVAEAFPDGVYFVGLADVRQPDVALSRVAQAVGLRDAGPGGGALTDFLLERNALLVLDNCEQLADSFSAISDILRFAPTLKALVTSQVVLHVYGEHEYGVEPLRDGSALELFAQRAQAARPDFAVNDENRAAVLEICRRLDGVPLAIELAAARVRTMTPQALLPKLRNSLDVLTGGARDLPERQRTMRAAIAWCHDLLEPRERELFRRLSVFTGSASATGAEAIGGTGPETDDVLVSLVDRSLLRQTVGAVGEARFSMLQPILEFATESLRAAGEGDDARDAHAVFFRSFALEAEPHVASGDADWVDRLEADHANLSAALRHLVERGLTADALRVGTALWRYWEARSYSREGLDLLVFALERLTDDVPVQVAQSARYAAGILSDSVGELRIGRTFLERHLEVCEEQGDPRASAVSANNLAILLMRHGEMDRAVELFERALSAFEGYNPQAQALALANIGNTERMRRRFPEARRRYGQARTIFEKIGDRVNLAWSFSHLGDVARDEKDFDGARAAYRDSVAIFSELAHKRGLAHVLTDLGQLVGDGGQLLEGRALLEEALVHGADLGDQRAMIRVFQALAGLLAADSQDEAAVTLAGAVVGLRDRMGSRLSQTERAVLEERVNKSMQRIGPARCETAWRAGVDMSIEDAISLVTTPSEV